MDKNEFAKIIDSICVIKYSTVTGAAYLQVVSPKELSKFGAQNSTDATARERGKRYVAPFNMIVRAIARHLGYDNPEEFYVTSPAEVNAHAVKRELSADGKHCVYIRSKRGYNNHGSRNGATKNCDDGGTHTTMKNRKITLSLVTLVSGFALTLQITGSSKDATAWTRFCDPDLSKAEYENITWTKDVASENQAAVDAVDAMIQVEQDYVDGKLDKDAALEQLREKYVEWVVAHLQTNPEFVERRVPGLNCDENLMSVYTESDEAE